MQINISLLFMFFVLVSSTVHAADTRFVDMQNGTMYDTDSNLFWLKDANCFGTQSWGNAMAKSNSLTSGQCGLSDGTKVGDWHLPTAFELYKLVDAGYRHYILNSVGFLNVNGDTGYWSSSTFTNYYGWSYAHTVMMDNGRRLSAYRGNQTASINNPDIGYLYVWPVRYGKSWSFGALQITAAVADYGNIPTGIANRPNHITLQNISTATITLSRIALTGASITEFTVSPGGASPCSSLTPTLLAGDSCTLIAYATPTTSGTKTANLTFTLASGSQDIPLTVNAYSTVHGTITDMSTGLPLSGATVTLSNSATVITNAYGRYDFGQLAEGTYSIMVSKVGYQNITVANLTVSSAASVHSDVRLPTTGFLNMPSHTLQPANLTQAYSYNVRVTGGAYPYAFSLSAGSSLPPGIVLNASTGELCGTPTFAGTYNFSIGVSDSAAGYAERPVSLNVAAPLTISTASMPLGEVGSSYTTSITKSGGVGPIKYNVSTESLPAGLRLDTSSGVISGVPVGILNNTATEISKLIITATDAFGRKDSKNYTITIAPTLALTTTRLADALVGIPYSQTLTGSGGHMPYNWEVVSVALPAGLKLNASTGEISGIPTAASSPSLSIGLHDITPRLTTKILTLQALNPLGIATSSLPNATTVDTYSQQVSIVGGIAPFTFSVSDGELPGGLTLNSSTGIISGTPTTAGYTNFGITVSDSTWPTPQNASKAMSIKTLRASYRLATHIVGTGSGTVHSSPQTDISCMKGAAAGCSNLFAAGSVIALVASPDAFSTFGGWSGACSTPSGNCLVTMSSSKDVTATFNKAPKAKIGTTGYDSLGAAYADAPTIATILALDSDMMDAGIILNQSKIITIRGGYKADYSGRSDLPTLLNGPLNVTKGKLSVDRLVIK